MISMLNLILNLIFIINGAKSCDQKTFNALVDTSSVILKALGGRLVTNENSQEFKNILILSPSTVYKGGLLLRSLKEFESSQYFIFDG